MPNGAIICITRKGNIWHGRSGNFWRCWNEIAVSVPSLSPWWYSLYVKWSIHTKLTYYQNPATVYEERCGAVCKTIAWAAKDTYRNRVQIPGKNLLPKRVFVSTWNAFSPENGLNVDSPGIWALFLLASCSEMLWSCKQHRISPRTQWRPGSQHEIKYIVFLREI